MSKILSLLNSKTYIAFSVIAIISLVISQIQLYRMMSQEDHKVLAFEESVDSALPDDTDEVITEGTSSPPYDPAFIPHPNCYNELTYTQEPSHIYNGESPYNLAFSRGTTVPTWQDINGDNLVDFIWSRNTIDGSTVLVQDYEACVYLNNGNGWDKAYVCKAITYFNTETKKLTRQDYWGDCAGASNN